jgi:hypothetical protein
VIITLVKEVIQQACPRLDHHIRSSVVTTCERARYFGPLLADEVDRITESWWPHIDRVVQLRSRPDLVFRIH